jgi:16S rRNA C967 or C1407 C5-methylase (RsmB/RsmF family)/NOL1/NOP2/fmu family ribosome biogenesis protein
MYPADFIKRIKSQDYIDADLLMDSMNRPAPVSIRINPAKLNMIPDAAEPVPWCGTGYYLDKRPSYTFDPLFHAGCYYPQEASSMFIGEIFRQLNIENQKIRVLDLCAAPGGKSTHLSSLIGPEGLLVANEVIRSRSVILAEILTKWGLGNTVVTNNDPVAFSVLHGYFDLILVDAPCSGEGMFCDFEVRNEWSVGNTTLCAERQRRILRDIWPALKEGGYLIYSTCTFNPAENEENINWFTKETGAESISIDANSFPGIKEISTGNISCYAFHPGKIKGEGFFFSIIRKQGATPDFNERSIKKSVNLITSSEIKSAQQLIDCEPDSFYKFDDLVYSLAMPVPDFLYLKKYLKIVKGGTALFKSRQTSFSPDPDLALNIRIKKGAFKTMNLTYDQAVKFLRKDSVLPGDNGDGWILLRYNGANLGFGKVTGKRMNNYYPVEWRIRMAENYSGESRLIEWKTNQKS